jgi:hypothetical protein
VNDDRHLVARIEALERAYGCPRRAPLLRCGQCGYEVIELARRRRNRTCPRCRCNALAHIATVDWPLARSQPAEDADDRRLA